jgi:hypothetical protein
MEQSKQDQEKTVLRKRPPLQTTKWVSDVLAEFADLLAKESNSLIRSRIILSDVVADKETYVIRSKTTTWYVYIPFPDGVWYKFIDVKTLVPYQEYPVKVTAYFGEEVGIEASNTRIGSEADLKNEINSLLNNEKIQNFLYRLLDRAEELSKRAV